MDYTIQPGDTLTALARRFGTTVEALAQANGVQNPDLIYAGAKLQVPDGTAPQEPPLPRPRPAISSGGGPPAPPGSTFGNAMAVPAGMGRAEILAMAQNMANMSPDQVRAFAQQVLPSGPGSMRPTPAAPAAVPSPPAALIPPRLPQPAPQAPMAPQPAPMPSGPVPQSMPGQFGLGGEPGTMPTMGAGDPGTLATILAQLLTQGGQPAGTQQLIPALIQQLQGAR